MTTFTLTSFNTRWGLTVDDRPYDVVANVARFDTDVVCLQEVWAPDGDDGPLAASAAGLGYRLLHAPQAGSTVDPAPEITADPDRIRGTWGVALLTRLPVQRVRVVELGRLVERWDVADRHAIVATLEAGEVALDLTAVHLSFALPNAAAQLRRLSGYLPAHRPSVVVGDCNLWGPAAATLVTRHRRAVRGRTWPAHRPHSQLDHILISPEVTARSAHVLPPTGSDHLPVTATLSV